MKIKHRTFFFLIALSVSCPAYACFTSAQFNTLIRNVKQVYTEEFPFIQNGLEVTRSDQNILVRLRRDTSSMSLVPTQHYEINGRVVNGTFRAEEITVITSFRDGAQTQGRWAMFLDYLKAGEEAKKSYADINSAPFFCNDCGFKITRKSVSNIYLVDLLEPLFESGIWTHNIYPENDLFNQII